MMKKLKKNKNPKIKQKMMKRVKKNPSNKIQNRILSKKKHHLKKQTRYKHLWEKQMLIVIK